MKNLFYSWFGPLWFGVFAICCCGDIISHIISRSLDITSWDFLKDVLCVANIGFYFFDYVRYRKGILSNDKDGLWLYVFVIIAALDVVFG